MFKNITLSLKVILLLLAIFQLHRILAQSNYHIAPYQSNWFEAAEYCHRMGMRLAIVDTEEKHNDVVREAKAAELHEAAGSFGVWLGATDLGRTNIFIWHNTGIRLRYTHWAAGEPSGGDEHCLELHYWLAQGFNWTWNDAPCHHTRYAMCENVEKVSCVEPF